jgi:hypothetical protein
MLCLAGAPCGDDDGGGGGDGLDGGALPETTGAALSFAVWQPRNSGYLRVSEGDESGPGSSWREAWCDHARPGSRLSFHGAPVPVRAAGSTARSVRGDDAGGVV